MSTEWKDHDNYDEVLASGSLRYLTVPLALGERRERIVLITPNVYEWMRDVLPDLKTDGFVDGAITPREQVLQFLRGYVSGSDFVPPLPHDMGTPEEGVYEMRTDDIRLFCWAPRKEMLCIGYADTKEKCKNNALYAGYRNETKRIRAEVGLYNGIYITGGLDELI